MSWLSKVLVGIGVLGTGGLIVKAIKHKKRELDEEREWERLADIKSKEYEEEYKRRKEAEERRRNTPCYFNGTITMNIFYSIVHKCTKHIKRLNITVEGPVIYGTVRSQSGISTWNFTLDFNDYGDITGDYWLWNENIDSNLPENVAESIKNEIIKLLSQ